MKPLILKSIYKEKVWGSKELLRKYKKETIKEIIGESWEISLNNNDVNGFENFDKNIKEIFENDELCKRVFGKRYTKIRKFPLLIKILFINKNTSLQVHPDNKLARRLENDIGKDEFWHVLYADEKAFIRISSKNIRQLKKEINQNALIKSLKIIKIKKGDSVRIPAGVVHSISGKAIIYEVQNNSNITYRIRDQYGRYLDKEKAIKAIKYKRVKIKKKEKGTLVKNKDFIMNRVNIYGKKDFKTMNEFAIITIIDGDGTLVTQNDLKLSKGMTILIPADLKKYSIIGKLTALIIKP